VGFADPEFRKGRNIRLAVLDGLLAAGRLGPDLRRAPRP
jgi:hypothetical protein